MDNVTQFPGVVLDMIHLIVSDRAQLMIIFSELGISLRDLDLDSSTGELNIPLPDVKKIREWMVNHPGELRTYWRQVLEPVDYERLINKANDGQSPARRLPLDLGAILDGKTEEGTVEKKTEKAVAEHFISIARACLTVDLKLRDGVYQASFDRPRKVVNVKIMTGAVVFFIDFHVEDCSWKVGVRAKKAASKVTSKDAPVIFKLFAMAWEFLEALEPDMFPGGLEDLQQAITACCEDWYELK